MSKRSKMTDRDYERARTDKIIAERFKTSCMSDTKWLRLLDALTAVDRLVDDCRAKLVWDDEIRYMQIDGMTRDFDYWPRAMEAMISGAPRGWYDYKELEWIEFPTDAEHDLGQIRSTIESVGQFELESTDAALRLYAYR